MGLKGNQLPVRDATAPSSYCYARICPKIPEHDRGLCPIRASQVSCSPIAFFITPGIRNRRGARGSNRRANFSLSVVIVTFTWIRSSKYISPAITYATHKHTAVQRWLSRNRRFHVQFTTTIASRLNMMERFFQNLSVNRLKRSVFRDLEELILEKSHAPVVRSIIIKVCEAPY